MNNILIVEDNPVNMALVENLLILNGFGVVKAVDGNGAFDLLRKQVPSLILLDIQLPDMDGFEIFTRIRQDHRLDKVKVVALTASAMKEDETRIKEIGFDEYITKPIDINEFVNKIKEILRKRS